MKRIRLLSVSLALVLCAGLMPGCEAKEETVKLQQKIPKYTVDVMTIVANTKSVQELYATKKLDAWNQYMSEKYNTSVTLKNYVSPRDNSVQIRLQNASEIFRNIRAGRALPLEDFLKDNEAWNRLPIEFRNRFSYDGHIYAIPRSSKTTLKVSSIRTDWLKQAGKSMPYTLEELLAAGRAFKSGQYLMGTFDLLNIDLLNAMGLYFSDSTRPATTQLKKTYLEGYLPLGYDPLKDEIMDYLFTPQAEEALDYFKQMADSGMISGDAFTGGNEDRVLDGEYGLIYGGVGFAKFQVDEAYEAMPPLSEEHPVTYADDDEAFTVNPDTPDPKETINLFVDMMFGSVENYLDFACGLPENYKIGSNRVITLNYTDEDIRLLPAMPKLIDCDDLFLGDSYIIVTPDQNVKEERQLRKQMRDYEQAYIQKHTKSGRLVKIPVWFSVIDNYFYNNLMNVPFLGYHRIIQTLDDPGQSALSQLESYRSDAPYIKVYDPSSPPYSPPVYVTYAQMVSRINAQIGKRSTQKMAK